MSLRIWDVIAQFIDTEAKAGDYINCSFLWLFKPPVVSTIFFFCFFGQVSGQHRKANWDLQTSGRCVDWPRKGEVFILDKSILITFL